MKKPKTRKNPKNEKPKKKKNFSSDFHIAQNLPIDPGAFEALADGGEPDGEDGAEKADEDDGRVVGVAARDGQVGRQAVEGAHDDDEQRGEQVAGVTEAAEIKGPTPGKDVGAATEEDEDLGNGVGDVLRGGFFGCQKKRMGTGFRRVEMWGLGGEKGEEKVGGIYKVDDHGGND